MKFTQMKYSFFIFLFFISSILIAQTTIDSTRLLQNLEELASDKYAGRATQSKGNELAQAYLIQQLKAMEVTPIDSVYQVPFTFWNWMKKEKTEGENIVAIAKGTQFPNQYIVLSAHYDHVGTKNNAIYNGADDNASGTCTLLELAAYFTKHPPKHSIIFAFFDAEELGLQGAKCFVDEPPISKDSIILNLNMDMISRHKKSELNICGTYHYPFLKSACDSLIATTPITITFGHDGPNTGQIWTNSSDHGAFHAEKIPFLYFGVEDHKDYHKPSDDFENIHPSFYYHASRYVLAVSKYLDEHWEALEK